MSLVRHIRKNQWSDLEQAWTELIVGSADVGPALDAVSLAGERKNVARCLPFIKDHAEALTNTDRFADAAELLGSAMLAGGSPGELGNPLVENVAKAWGEESYFPAYSEISSLHQDTPNLRAAWRSFRKLLALEKERVIYHAKGWGLGIITDVNHDELEVQVNFTSGKKDRFPFATAIDIFDILEPDDLRALVVTDPERLQKMLKNEPLDVLRWVVKRANGRANHSGIKLAMTTLGLEGAKFTAWWRRAKKQAETSEWFELSGPATRVQVRLLDVAEDPAIGLKRQLLRSKNLADALTRVKAIFAGGSIADDVREVALECVREMAKDESELLSSRLAVWLFIREETEVTPPALVDALAHANSEPLPEDPSQPPALWALFHQVPGQREQERCIELLQEVHGDEWLDDAALHLAHAAPGMARALVEALFQDGRTDVIVEQYGAILARSTRNPRLLIALAECVEKKDLKGDFPSPLQRAQCLLQLAVYLYKNSPGKTILTRARARLNTLLAEGKTPLLPKLLANADRETLRALANLIDGGVDVVLDRVYTRAAIAIVPDLFRGDDLPFWELETIWTTRAGLDKHEEELRILKEVKIPENSEAIGRAAAYGDLSENSEWEAAIEEQRNLTGRAMAIEEEVRLAQLLENQPIAEGIVAPGTKVDYVDPDGANQVVSILGPWDATDEIISYRSPLAQGMLGHKAGETVTVKLPTGSVKVKILKIGLLDF